MNSECCSRVNVPETNAGQGHVDLLNVISPLAFQLVRHLLNSYAHLVSIMHSLAPSANPSNISPIHQQPIARGAWESILVPEPCFVRSRRLGGLTIALRVSCSANGLSPNVRSRVLRHKIGASSPTYNVPHPKVSSHQPKEGAKCC